MTLPSALGAYNECQQLFDKALEGHNGARAKFDDQSTCINMRTRLHYFRKLDRDANAKTYPADHPQHGQSLYDDFVVQILPDEDGDWWIYIQRRSSKIRALETLDEDDGLVEVESTASEVHQIEDHSNG